MKRYSENIQQTYRRTLCCSTISIKLQSNFVEITLLNGCSPANLRYMFRTPFPSNIYGGLLLLNLISGFAVSKSETRTTMSCRNREVLNKGYPLHEKQHFCKNAKRKYRIFLIFRNWRKYHISRKTKIKEHIISDIFRNKSIRQDFDDKQLIR